MGFNYRRVWFTNLARFIGFPALALNLALRVAGPASGSSSKAAWLLRSKLVVGVLHVLAVPVFWSIKNVIADIMKAREAKRLGGIIIPRVKGKLPGNIDIMKRMVTSLNGGYVAESFEELAEEYGNTYNMRLWWEDMIFTMDHEVIKYVLATGFPSFDKGERLRNRMESLLGNGIFNRDGDLWKFHRNMTRPFFVRERVTEFELFDRYTKKLINRVAELTDQEVAIDMQDLFSRLSMDAAGEFLFGSTDLNTLDMELPIAGKALVGPRGSAVVGKGYGGFLYAFEDAQVLIPLRGRLGPHFWPLLEIKGDKNKVNRDQIDQWIQPLLDAAFERRKKYLNSGGDATLPAGDTFLDDLVSSTDDRVLIADELVNILLAARDTTASLLTFATYLFTQHPDVLAKLRAEVLDHVGPVEAPTYEHVKEMKYMRAVLNETLRLFPPVPLNERATLVPVTVPTAHGPLYIPKGVPVAYSALLMQRRKDLWGEDADEFDPERWLDERNKAFVADPMRFVPFNAGPRICLGQQFALNEATFVVTRLLQRFEHFELAMEAAPAGCVPPAGWKGAKGRKGIEKVWPRNALTLYSKGGMWVKARKAGDQ